MDFLYLDEVYKKPYLIPALIIASAAFTTLINFYGLENGITNVLPHLFYLPIILAAYYYPRHGVPVAVILSAIYCGMVVLAGSPSPDVFPSAVARAVVFIIVAGVVSYLSGRIHHDTQMCRRLFSIVTSSNDAIIGLALDGTITEWNNAATRLYGFTEGEIVGKPISQLSPPSRSQEIPQFLGMVRNDEIIERHETEQITKEGKTTHVSLSISPIKNRQNEIIGASAIGHDITERKRFENEILNAKNEWERTFDAVPDLIAIIDRNYRILRVNKAMADRLGLPPEKIVKRICFEVIDHTNTPVNICPLTHHTNENITETQEVHLDSLNGDFLISVSSLHDVTGNITGSVHLMRDITERKRAERALQESEAKYRAIVETSPNIIWEIDPDGKFVYISPQSELLLGYTRKELEHASIMDLYPPGKRDWIRNYLTAQNTSVQSFEVVAVHHQTKEKIILEIYSKPVFGETGILLGFRGMAVDITQRKKAQKELAESERFLHRLIETISNPIFYKDKNGNYTGCNTAFLEYIGLPREKVIGKSVYDTAPKDLADIYSAKDRELFTSPGTESYEAKARHADGTMHDVIFNKTTLTDSEGHVEGLVGVIIDITDRKKMEGAIRAANEKLNMLSSITRHDILNKLTGLRAYLELTRELSTDPQLLAFIAREEEAAEAIERQIEFTRFYQDIGVKDPAWVDVEKSIRSSTSQLPLDGIGIDITFSGFELYADPLIEKVFYNLIENSLRHGGHVTQIGFLINESGQEMKLVYYDNGVGIADEDKKKLFSKGFGKHTGLGLFLTREILAITGLSITENGTPGTGARFEILVPFDRYRFHHTAWYYHAGNGPRQAPEMLLPNEPINKPA
ncbi:MAG: PAS domain S-box protein [Methanoregula sp.]|jgi:PAS domain S-box-containing protein